jgi:hypothetical protein
VSASWKEPPTLAAITPLVGGVKIAQLPGLEEVEDLGSHDLFTRIQGQLAMSVSALYSKHQFMKRLHRKGRGPKSSIRRYLGGDGETVGPGSYRVVPAALLGLKACLGREDDLDGNAGRAASLRHLMREIADYLSEEGRKSGLLITLAVPWANGSAAGLNGQPDTAKAAIQESMEWHPWVDLDPIQDYFKGDATDRIAFIRMILDGLTERGHAP